MDGIMFSLVAVPEEIAGGKKVYRAYVKTNGTVDKEARAKALAGKTGQDVSLANYFLDALNEILAKEIVAGYRVNLGQLSTGFSIKGSFQSEDDRFDPTRHSVQPTNLGYAAGDSVTIADGDHTWTFTGEAIKSGSDTELVLDYMKAVREDDESGFNPETDGPLTIAYKGSTLAAEYKATR